MKQIALDLFGYGVGLLGFAPLPCAGQQENAGQPDAGSRLLHGDEIDRIPPASTAPLVQIGVVALDYRASETASGGHSRRGPARIVASVG